MTIIYNIDYFGQNSLSIHDGKKQKIEGYVDATMAPVAIAELCYKKNIYDVIIIGNTGFYPSLTEEVQNHNASKYNNKRKINIEVM